MFISTTFDILYLLKLGCIFVNKYNNSNLNYILREGDLLELLISNNYINYTININNIILKNSFRYANKLKNRTFDVYHKRLKEKRINKNTRRFNLTVYTNFSNNFEVDFLSLSAVMVKTTKNIHTNSTVLHALNSYFIMRLYN